VLVEILKGVKADYAKNTTPKLMLVDGLIVTSLLTAVVQVLYLVLVGSFPFNSFLSGFLACLGTYAFAVSLRMRLTADEFKDVSSSQAFAEFTMCCLTMYFIVACFLG
jgi:oligosaccharyltransferase complex subunit epsilon